MSSYAKKAQNPNNFIVFDFETGGLNNNKSAITEIALIAIDGGTGEKIAEYSSLITPYSKEVEYNEKALEVTGISMEMLEEEGKDIRIVATEVLETFNRANNRRERSAGLKPILVGHNVQFDLGFLHHLIHRGLGGTVEQTQKSLEQVLHGTRDYYGHFQPTYLDTWALCKSWLQDERELPNYKLSTVVEKLGIDINNAHRAMNDVISTTEVLRVWLTAMRNGLNSDGLKRERKYKFPI